MVARRPALAAMRQGKPPRFTLNAVVDPSLVIDKKRAEEGVKIYDASFCWMCHGQRVESSGSIAPDLRESRRALSWEAFRAVLHEGTLAGAGTPKFDDFSDEDTRDLYIYIRQRARGSVVN